ncbi:hypothetical protein MOO44_08370 [Nicoliella spurrieriana]|uniref:SCP domain-containing protein n=1 Tax=Nicoliella spurrieriana TaxID=2925830 RepID=A0A976X5B2_9LACO|nr:hypothetical protein [Nicoliella spurrieriana]UQS86863.1 hypothetical protein MOO44_08370 [Nicoliella spurrieriana]
MKKIKLLLATTVIATLGTGVTYSQTASAKAPKTIRVFKFSNQYSTPVLISSSNQKYTGTLKRGTKINYHNRNYYYIKRFHGYIAGGKAHLKLSLVSYPGSTGKADATHKYIVSSKHHSAPIMDQQQFHQLINQKADGSFGADSGFENYRVHIIKTQTVAGYSFTEIDQLTGNHDREKSWIYSGYLGNKRNVHVKYVSLDKIYAKQSKILANQNQSSDSDSNDQNSGKNDPKLFTTDEINQIQEYQNEANAIGNVTNPYSVKPVYQNSFNVGQLNPAFIQNTVDWLNFYRKMFGLSEIQDDSNWDSAAQYGATTLAAANQGLSHGLVGFNKPDFISQDDWQRGIDATASSNLASGVSTPYDIINTYLNDNGDQYPGHRQWLFGNIGKIGVGQAGTYNDLKVFEKSEHNDAIFNITNSALPFPKAGLCPINLVDGAYWTLSLPYELSSFPSYSSHYHVLYKDASTESDQYDPSRDSSTVTIHDNTANQDVPVSNVALAGDSGDGNVCFTFKPDDQYIKVGHSYTVTVTGLPNNQTYTYTTKLFNLKS